MERKIKSSLCYVSLVLFLFCQIVAASTLTPQEIAKKALDSTVLLVTGLHARDNLSVSAADSLYNLPVSAD